MGISDSETTSHISGTPLRPDGLGGFILSVYTRGHMKKEIKSTLARLLATENLLVEHKQVPTASFDVHKRLLTLPMWNRASDTVYDLLVGHEVGHALYTPDDDTLDNLPCPKDYLNVTEDARIEKLMKRKYPGLAKDFYRGYQELNDDDFFVQNDKKQTCRWIRQNEERRTYYCEKSRSLRSSCPQVRWWRPIQYHIMIDGSLFVLLMTDLLMSTSLSGVWSLLQR